MEALPAPPTNPAADPVVLRMVDRLERARRLSRPNASEAERVGAELARLQVRAEEWRARFEALAETIAAWAGDAEGRAVVAVLRAERLAMAGWAPPRSRARDPVVAKVQLAMLERPPCAVLAEVLLGVRARRAERVDSFCVSPEGALLPKPYAAAAVSDAQLISELGGAVGTDHAATSPAAAAAGSSSAGAAADAERITPPNGTKQAQRATELANTVYAGVKQKMSAMRTELQSLREGSAVLQAQLVAAEEQHQAASREVAAQAEAKLAAQAEASELTIQRHLAFIDRLLSDKAELAKQCEALGGQLKALEDKYAAQAQQREEAFAKELKKQRELWGQQEKAKREQWLADKTREIKESTVRGLEPDIQRLVARHREESKKLEEELRETFRQELSSERARSQRELARLQEASLAEKHAAQEREREACSQRLHQMTLHFEEQQTRQRQRHARDSAAELAERDEQRRKEISRLEDELREAKSREDAARADARSHRAELEERLRDEHRQALGKAHAAHESARAEWEAAFESEVARRVAEAKVALEASTAEQRTQQVRMVVDKLGVEMAAAERSLRAEKEEAIASLRTKHREELAALRMERDELKTSYMASVETANALQARREVVCEELAVCQRKLSESAARSEEQQLHARTLVERASDEARQAYAATQAAQVLEHF
jgi:5-azacytidine-induced protein 1